jgi:hypothetical protein
MSTYFTMSNKNIYQTGTISQSGTTVTGVGTTFTPAMIGGVILVNGILGAFITGFTSATVLTVAQNQTISSTAYSLYYGGLQSDSSGLSSINAADASSNFVNIVDPTKQLGFNLSSATTGTILTLKDQQTTSQTLNIPNITTTDTILTAAATQTETNKTITGTTNTVDANNLRNGSTWVVPLGGAAPTANQVLAYNGSNTIWTSPSAVFPIDMQNAVISTATTLTNVQALQDLNSMTLTTHNLGSTGAYKIIFTGFFNPSSINAFTVVLNVNGSDVAATSQTFNTDDPVSISIVYQANLASGVIIKVRWSNSTGGTSVTSNFRSLQILGVPSSNLV